MASATDIITYIGVPLAVLGVLPILYNTALTLVHASKIKRVLRHSRLTALTRSDVVNRVIEIELPRYAVTPWDRFQHLQEYWTLSRNPSTIPGGSWTTFHWKTNAVGFKTQRVEYADQLRQPQADIAFDELVAYLLDLGAVPDPHGWRLLRSTGLWTPVGCALLKSPDGLHTALALAPLDDADGNLSLAVTWRPEWTTRSFSDLPPYWVSLPAPPEPADVMPALAADGPGRQGRNGGQSPFADVPETTHSSTASVPATIHGEDETGTEAPDTAGTDDKADKADRPATAGTVPSSIRKASLGSAPRTGAAALRAPITCHISVDGIVTALVEHPAGGALKMDSLYIEHLRLRASSKSNGIWFASAATTYGTTSQTILWNYRIPDDILAFARRDSVPCGVMELLHIVDDSETPEWATTHTEQHVLTMELHMRRINEQRSAQAAEQRLPPGQREAAMRDRVQNENMQRIQDMRDRMRRDQERRSQRDMEALQSPKWDVRLVADHNLRWLLRQQKERLERQAQKDPSNGTADSDAKATSVPITLFPENVTVKQAAGMLLHRMVRDGQFAGQLCLMLDRWKAWAAMSGMKRDDLQALRAEPAVFAQASLLLALVRDSSSEQNGTLSADLQDCLRLWRNVRLG